MRKQFVQKMPVVRQRVGLEHGRWALSFDGSASYVRADNAITGYPFTLEAWAKRSATKDHVIVSIAHPTSSTVYFKIAIFGDKAHLAARNSGLQRLTGTTAISEGEWAHIAGVFTSATRRDLYLNGGHEGDDTSSENFNTGVDRVLFGLLRSVSPALYFDGNIRDVRIWSTARSQEEIQNNMDRVLGGNETGLAGYWPTNTGEGSVVYDKSGNDNNGDIWGAIWVAK